MYRNKIFFIIKNIQILRLLQYNNFGTNPKILRPIQNKLKFRIAINIRLEKPLKRFNYNINIFP